MQCVDINECVNSTCNQSCVNSFGSFKCACNDGYALLSDGKNCEDVDECSEAALNAVDLCVDDPNTQCSNRLGSFECVCVPGFARENGTCQTIEEEPPPPPSVATPPNGLESSVSFFSPTLNISDFTPERQQQFREVTASAVVGLCLNTTCTVVTTDGDREERFNLQLKAQNIAIPPGIINQLESGELNITFYIQLDDGSILNMENLTIAVEFGVEEYRNAGFLPDIDECITENGGCEQVCINTDGSFHCDCNDGYTLNAAGTTCDDIHECSTNNGGCEQVCTNTVGSFNCSCNDGYSLNVDGATCDDIDECSSNRSGCDHFCSNTVGSFNCSCNHGFYLNSNGATCDDIDECFTNSSGCDQICTNTVGSFNCSCNGEYSLNVDGATCDDIDECDSSNGGCEQVCTNTIGSFNCSCNDGYSLNDDEATCDDIDECDSSNGGCEQVCTNTIGSFNCSCNDGYSLNVDGATCDDIDECDSSNGGCEQVCTNTIGSFNCSCNDGYCLNVDGASCDDIDECVSSNGGCEQVCTNTVGSFNCSCNDGFSLNVDGTSCEAMEILPKIEEQAGLLISLKGYNIQTFTVEVQDNFKVTTAMALNLYCAKKSTYECAASPVLIRKRQSRLFTEEDIVIANIVDVNRNVLQFELYVLLEEDVSVLPKDVVQNAIQDNTEVYQSSGFTSFSAQFLVATRLSTAEIIGIIIGSLIGVLLAVGLVIGFCYLCYRHSEHSQTDAKQCTHTELSEVVMNPTFKENPDGVQCVSITFKDGSGYGSRPTTPVPELDHEEETSIV